MTIRPRKKCCGFTLFEFAVAAGLLGLFVAALLSRVVFYQGEAERVAAEQLIATVRRALEVRVAQTVGHGGQQELDRIADENPIRLLAEQPHNYLGEYYAPNLAKLPTGNWFYDRNDKTLVYLPTSYKSFSMETSKFLKFKVKFTHLHSPVQGKGPDGINKGLSFDQVSDSVAVNN